MTCVCHNYFIYIVGAFFIAIVAETVNIQPVSAQTCYILKMKIFDELGQNLN